MSNRWPHILFDKRRANTTMVSMSPEFGNNNYAEIFGEIISGQVHFFEIIITQTEYTFKIDGKNVTNNNMGPGKDYESGYVPITQRIAPILWGSPYFGVINGLKVWELQIQSIPYVSITPTISPTNIPSKKPTQTPTKPPSNNPSVSPTNVPSNNTETSSVYPTETPTIGPTRIHSNENYTNTAGLKTNKSIFTALSITLIVIASLLCITISICIYICIFQYETNRISPSNKNDNSIGFEDNIDNGIEIVYASENGTNNNPVILGKIETQGNIIQQSNNNTRIGNQIEGEKMDNSDPSTTIVDDGLITNI